MLHLPLLKNQRPHWILRLNKKIRPKEVRNKICQLIDKDQPFLYRVRAKVLSWSNKNWFKPCSLQALWSSSVDLVADAVSFRVPQCLMYLISTVYYQLFKKKTSWAVNELLLFKLLNEVLRVLEVDSRFPDSIIFRVVHIFD